MMMSILLGLSVAILGIFLGAQLTEAVLFVPYWKKMLPKDFFEFYQIYGSKIHQFFAPMTILATVIPLLTMVYSFIESTSITFYTISMGIFTLLFFSTYYLYFKKANESFVKASLTDEELPAELEKWNKWHWSRIVFELAALVFALAALILI